MRRGQQMTEKPWYHAGLKFECTACGDCCTGAPGFVWVTNAEIQEMAGVVGLSVEGFEKRYVRKVGVRKSLIELAGGDCIFFNSRTRRCEVYSARPRQCRTWPFWGSNLVAAADWERTRQACPGCGQGRLYTLEEIHQRTGTVKV